jgi:hypothetical protein
MADKPPRKLTIPSGGRLPYVIRCESPVLDMMMGNCKDKVEKVEKMNEDDAQDQIDEQMKGFLNPQDQVRSTSSASSSSKPPPTAAVPTVTTSEASPQGTYQKADLAELKTEMMGMMKALEERQSRAELRQDVAEKRIEGAIAEIVSEHKAMAASTTQDVGDLKSMLQMMMQQQSNLAQQQNIMMQMLQGEDRRVKPKVENQSAQ